MQRQFTQFQEQQNEILHSILNQQTKNGGKGKGRGKKSVNKISSQNSVSSDNFQTAVHEEAQRRLRSFIESTQNPDDPIPCTSQQALQSTRSIVSNWTEDESIQDPTTKTVYIKKISVTLNGNPIDLVDDRETEDEVQI